MVILNDFELLIESYARTKKDFFFIQIGANDGKINDPIHGFIRKYKWKGILLEPQHGVFEKKLLVNYRDVNGLIFINAAISDRKGKRDLYKISFSTARWATGLASFYRKFMEECVRSDYVKNCAAQEGVIMPSEPNKRICTETVNCITFTDLIGTYNINEVDLLQIDTEGYDYEVIKYMDFSGLKPKIINFENRHLTRINECYCLLKQRGYNLIEYGYDTVAFQKCIFL